MSLTNTQYAAVMRMYDDIHTHNVAIQNSRYNEVVELCPQYQTIEDEIIALSMKEAVRRIGNNSSDTDTDEFSSHLKALIDKKIKLLASIGKPADYLEDIYTCKNVMIPDMSTAHDAHALRKRQSTLYTMTLT